MRAKTPKLLIEGFPPGPSAAYGDSFFQKRGSAHKVQDGLPLAEHMEVAFTLEYAPSPPLTAELPEDVEQAISGITETPYREVGQLWKETLTGLRERAAEL